MDDIATGMKAWVKNDIDTSMKKWAEVANPDFTAKLENVVVGTPDVNSVALHYDDTTVWVKKSDIDILDPVYKPDTKGVKKTMVAGHTDDGMLIEIYCRETIPCILGMILHNDPAYYVLGMYGVKARGSAKYDSKSLYYANELMQAIEFYSRTR